MTWLMDAARGAACDQAVSGGARAEPERNGVRGRRNIRRGRKQDESRRREAARGPNAVSGRIAAAAAASPHRTQ